MVGFTKTIENKDDLIKYLLYVKDNEIIVGIIGDVDISEDIDPKFRKKLLNFLKGE